MTDKKGDWEALDTFEDELSAQVHAGLLRNEGVPVEVRVKSPLPGLVVDVQVWVPSSMADRARTIIKTSAVSDEELNLAATGESGKED